MTVHQQDTRALPLVIEGDPGGPDLPQRIAEEHTRLRKQLSDHGALLFRGFPVASADGVDEFGQVVRALSGDPLAYSERSSPRTSIKGNIYTSTDYPPSEEIFLHNENSYQSSWPRLVYFYCDQPPETLGATPLADVRQVHDSIDSSVRDEFARRGWMVVRNFHDHFGITWRQLFNTDAKSAVEEYCRSRAIQFEWRGDDGLRTKAVRSAIYAHPDTGENVWFNHATFFHYTTLPADVGEGLLALFGEEGLPTNTYYGDGGKIPGDVTAHLRDRYRAASRRFDWQQGDVLVVDNMLTAHGREPFTGPRRIAVAMAEQHLPQLESSVAAAAEPGSRFPASGRAGGA
ncbi:MAG TPA: TauD/TfdA family dioxygenase [Streptosporangiaceae bacterium]|nr:TauD/TfdA family dioxygenase [Streptosporangiaceae bacterium]